MLCLGEGASEQPTHDKGTRKLVISLKNVNHAAYLVKRWEEYILRSLECSRFARSSQQWDPSIHFPHCGDKSKVLRGIIGFEFAQILKVGYHFKIIFMAILLDANSPYLCCRVLGFNTIVIISKALFVHIKAKHCQRHNGPEGWVLLNTKVTSLGHITSSNTNLDQTSSINYD